MDNFVHLIYGAWCAKGQLNAEWIYVVIISPKMPTKNYKDFSPIKQTRMVVKKTAYNHQKSVLWSLFVW